MVLLLVTKVPKTVDVPELGLPSNKHNHKEQQQEEVGHLMVTLLITKLRMLKCKEECSGSSNRYIDGTITDSEHLSFQNHI